MNIPFPFVTGVDGDCSKDVYILSDVPAEVELAGGGEILSICMSREFNSRRLSTICKF